MERELALNLPADMEWISEPLPSLSTIHNNEEIIFFEDEFANEISVVDFVKPNPSIEMEITDADYAVFEEILQLQKDLSNESMSDPESSVASMSDLISEQWMDQPINGPLNEYSPTQDIHIQPVQEKTVQLLDEFNCVYNTFDSSHLTPPQTPPLPPPETLHSVHLNDSPENQCNYYPQPVANNIDNYQFNQYIEPLINHQNVSMPIQPNGCGYSLFEQAVNLVQESNGLYQDTVNIKSVTEADAKIVAEVDEFVRSQAEGYDDDCTSTSGASSYSLASASSSDAGSSHTDDSDWIPATSGQSIGAVGVAALKAKHPAAKRKPRSNRRSKEDRALRKKEQNKNAANRYRMKKKAEIDILIDKERDLQKHNDSLMTRFTDINREVKCLKSLLRELFQEKGLL